MIFTVVCRSGFEIGRARLPPSRNRGKTRLSRSFALPRISSEKPSSGAGEEKAVHAASRMLDLRCREANSQGLNVGSVFDQTGSNCGSFSLVGIGIQWIELPFSARG